MKSLVFGWLSLGLACWVEPAWGQDVKTSRPAVEKVGSRPAPQAIGPLAPPHPLVAQLVALFVKNVSPEDAPTLGTLDEAECRLLTGFQGREFQRCSLELLANGTAAAVHVAYDCGAHTCSVESWVWYGAEPAPQRLAEGSAPIEVSPDHRSLLITELEYAEFPPTPIGGRTLRSNRASQRREPFFDCFSARLSPAGRYYVCRDVRANVLRVPVSGGKPELVVRVALPPNESVKLGGAFDDFPAQVTFPSPGELEYEVFLEGSGEVQTHRAKWSE